MEPRDTAAPARSRRDRIDAERIVAFGVALALHVGVLWFLFGESAIAPPVVAVTEKVEVQLLSDPRGVAAGSRTDAVHDAMPSSAPARIAPPKPRVVAAAKRIPTRRIAPDPVPVVVAERVPPPPIEAPRVADRGATSTAATRVVGDQATPGDAGSGHRGDAESGEFRRIAFVSAVKPFIDFEIPRDRRDTFAIVVVRIDRKGQPHDARLIRASGVVRLDSAILDAVSHSHYKPHVENGMPVEFQAIIPYVFGRARPDLGRVLAEAGFSHT